MLSRLGFLPVKQGVGDAVTWDPGASNVPDAPLPLKSLMGLVQSAHNLWALHCLRPCPQVQKKSQAPAADIWAKQWGDPALWGSSLSLVTLESPVFSRSPSSCGSPPFSPSHLLLSLLLLFPETFACLASKHNPSSI